LFILIVHSIEIISNCKLWPN